jgi:hypothetical protein
MQRNQKEISARGLLLLVLIVITALAMREGLTQNTSWYSVAFITLPIVLLLLLPYRKEKEV